MTFLSRPLATFAATLWPRLGMGLAGIAKTAKTIASSTPAPLASPLQRPDGGPRPHPLELALRNDLERQIKQAPPRSQRKAELTARAKALTCEILSKGR